MASKHLAIQLVCKIIEGVPNAEMRNEVMSFACVALGRYPDRTGISFSPDRPIHHLAWDLELKNLNDRLVELVETTGVWEQTLVLGLMGFLLSHFGKIADEGFQERGRHANTNVIANQKAQLSLPINQRDSKQTDEQINNFIATLEDIIESSHSRMLEAAEVTDYLQDRMDTVFTPQFWESYAAISIGDRPQRLIDDYDQNEGQSD